jgi:DNA ligase (NAD+)
VIPEIPERIPEKGKKRDDPVSPPPHCPVCGSRVEKEGAYYFCSNGLACKAQIKGHIVHFASKEAMDIDHLGEKTVNMLVERGMAERLSDIFYLKKEDYMQLEGFAEKSSEQLFDAVQSARRPDLDRFIYSLGIRHTGRHIARLLAAQFGTLDAVMKADKKSLLEIEEIGEQIAESVNSFFSKDGNIADIERMKKAGVKVTQYQKSGQRALEGLTFVFTGELQHYTRDEAKEEIERRGGRAASSVSGNTDYLVAGKNPGGKYDDAEKENVTIIGEEDFEALLSK